MLDKKKWEIEHSSLYKQTLIQQMITKNLTLKMCRDFSRKDIVNNLTPIETNKFFTEMPEEHKFCYLVRVDTTLGNHYIPELYFNQFRKRKFISFSTITHENISHYNNNEKPFLFAYAVPYRAIAHVFPCDSDTDTIATKKSMLTDYPSLWLTLEELDQATKEIGVYNQITCSTKILGRILKPVSLISLGDPSDEAIQVAKKFDVNCLILHPKNAISYSNDLMFDHKKMPYISEKLNELYGIDYYYPTNLEFL